MTLTASFWQELEVRRQWNDIIKVMKEKILVTREFHSQQYSFSTMEGKLGEPQINKSDESSSPANMQHMK